MRVSTASKTSMAHPTAVGAMPKYEKGALRFGSPLSADDFAAVS
jgi:hypothetical protein